MDLNDALDLARKGRQQAPVSLRQDGREPMPAARPGWVNRKSSRPATDLTEDDRPVRTPEQTDFTMTPQEWYGHVENVARELAEMAEAPHWYDMREPEREEWRELAGHALVAVSRANVWLKQRRISDRVDPIVDGDSVDTAEREALAGIGGLDARKDDEALRLRRAQIDRLRELAESGKAA